MRQKKPEGVKHQELKRVLRYIATRPMYPAGNNRDSGISYREWLIGQALAGLSACESDHEFDPFSFKRIASDAITLANEIIIMLARSVVQKTETFRENIRQKKGGGQQS